MFEKALPISRPLQSDALLKELSDDMLVGSDESTAVRGGALRAIEWSELTTRLNAARDLRQVLRRDARQSFQATAASFGDAAATYFQSIENEEQHVNPVALEGSKASRGNVFSSQDDVTTGDARED